MASGVERNSQIRAHRLGHIDADWPEVVFINDYAVFMGYLSLAVTGTGILVLTWSIVVLLGGFVSILAAKDFWSLTVITLVQTSVFDVFLNRNISNIGYSVRRLWETALFIALPTAPFLVWSTRGVVRVLVFTIVLCPLFAFYMFGLFVSPWISLWRLIQQDYGRKGEYDSTANLKPALVVLYSLALFQGVLFYYRAISTLEEKKLVDEVVRKYEFDDKESVSDYLRVIRVGCEKDPTFARGRNLITYAADLMESKFPDSYLSGARILDTLINSPAGSSQIKEQSMGQRMLINNMIGSASSVDTIPKLVQMLDSRSPYDREIRLRAVRIVSHFATEIRLDKIVQGVWHISKATNSLFSKKRVTT